MDERDPERDGDNHMDYEQHEQSYKLFISLTQWTVVSVAVVLILMAIFLL